MNKKFAPAFTFPFRGIWFLIRHPKQLWLKTLSPILLTILFSAFSIGFSIKYLLPGLANKMISWHWPHWMSWFVSIISTVLEGAIINLIFFAFLVPIFQDSVFDATLKARGLERIFEEEEERDIPKLVVCWRNMRSSILVTWILITIKILLLVLTAPLQLVPVVGNALACTINGWPTAWNLRLHYDIELRGYKVSESYHHARDNKWTYVSMGAAAFALELIPLFNIIFTWTNIVGAGLWVADEYERENTLVTNDSKDRSIIYPVAQAPTTSAASDERTPLLQQSE
ncbi:hypothetical protein A0J61_02940 [Choanephora cucurbitarum]|uniref:Sulfate transporter CysZ n=1 Tax=Choanephora cucurbitarum TaxID=101091 RepID=A0A1C7NJL8_9FUNG|nr:hypothetical protein A0J61_02940 [Choanephora cucurbitarum]